jgi:hypothetical protein
LRSCLRQRISHSPTPTHQKCLDTSLGWYVAREFTGSSRRPRGKLWAREAVKRRLQPPRELADFNTMEPEAIPPPDWAKHW